MKDFLSNVWVKRAVSVFNVAYFAVITLLTYATFLYDLEFAAGREKSFFTVSRSHANIVKRGNDYFIVDTNSTNHTYVNGAMIQSNVEIKLEENTRIKFANEEFEFRFF